MKIFLPMLIITVFANAGIIHPQLGEILNTMSNTDELQVIVHMKNHSTLDHFEKDTPKTEKLLYLQHFAENDQKAILRFLNTFGDRIKELQTYWIFNGFTFSSTKEIIEAVAAREDVDYVIDNFSAHIHAKKSDGIAVPEWGIAIVSAPECWNDGYDGAGTILGNIDTGVDESHPAFGGRWLPGGWHDPINNAPNPEDDHNHGTHTMGTICGGDGNGPFADDIGVAPAAQFIAAKG
jgi:bacillopeptidase F